ncbi:hypothetical protein SUGI_0212510 [Cryptomeria japonica]|nr:hypothetical protein SUGI_0212510 [Cryptomeria japonica]
MMQLTRGLDPKRALITFRSPIIHKHLPLVSATNPFYRSISNADIYTKAQIKYSCSLQDRWYLRRPFSSKSSQVSRKETSNIAKLEDCELICKVVNQTEWSDKIETELSSLNIKLSNYIVLSVLQNLKETPGKAFNFFKWVSTQTDFWHTTSTYNALFTILGQEQCIDQFSREFSRLLREMYDFDHVLSKKTYHKLLRTLLDNSTEDNSLEEHAVSLFINTVSMYEYEPCSLGWRMILHHLLLSGNPDMQLVDRLLFAVESWDEIVDKESYDAIHRCLTMASRFDAAEGIMMFREASGHAADNNTFGQLMFGLCKAGTVDEARGVLDRMKEVGCTPNFNTWNILIEGHCKAGQINQLLGYVEFMVLESGGNADCEGLDALVKTLCSHNRIEDAHIFLCKMASNEGLKAWALDTLEKLLQKMINAESLQDAFKLSDLIVRHGLPAIVKPFNNHFARCGAVEGSLDFLNKLTRNVPQYESLKLYNQMLHAFCKKGKKAEAQILFSSSPPHVQQNPYLLFKFRSRDTPSAAQKTRKTKIQNSVGKSAAHKTRKTKIQNLVGKSAAQKTRKTKIQNLVGK